MVDYVSEQTQSHNLAVLGEQVFFSKDVAQIAGISLRQLRKRLVNRLVGVVRNT